MSAFKVSSKPELVISPKFWVSELKPVVREIGTSKIRSEEILLKYSIVPLTLLKSPKSKPILKLSCVSHVKLGLPI